MQDHIVKSFDIELTQLNEAIMDMAKKCEHQLEKALQAFKMCDIELANKVVANDQEINEARRGIEDQVASTLARRQPLAVDLRKLLSTMRLASELERIGDYAANIANRVSQLNQAPSGESQSLIIDMTNTGRVMLHDATMAFLMLDLKKAVQVWNKDDEIDDNYIKVITLIKENINKEENMIDDGTHLLFIARCCERIGDHVTNIAEDIYYIISGKRFLGEFSL